MQAYVALATLRGCECNVSGAAIHQRMQKMINQGIINGSEFHIDPFKIGLETCAYMGLYLKDPSDFDRIVEALLQIPEVVECHYTTGKYDLFIKMYVKDNATLKSIIHDKLLPLGLARTETMISFSEVFKRPLFCYVMIFTYFCTLTICPLEELSMH